ncbi:NTP/NDP exchange transporter [Marilutibacter chinensis]|uniref:MFS transporter n=1 Tax=Marilutibacter chinensis TaxID=2912247 RepID=A0ABS9HVW6_9GAMM|nr:MFS transporter [Lysobacter chinensis]MCF7221208.1 MFS transporter [Lysobacter chinensis]MCF7223051.1 MFS transporter [Lysobacter chinensis]
MTPPNAAPHAPGRWASRLFGVGGDEAMPVLAGALLFFLLFTGYFMLRPVRETMGIAGGVDNLQWLFTATFFATLAAMPLFGWVAARVQRRRILAWVYGFFAANLLAFAAAIHADPGNAWLARGFYVWLSVFNMIAISLAWSVLVDLFPSAQAKRTFALMAAGASLGGLTGPLLGVALVGTTGHGGLLAIAALFLLAAIVAGEGLQRWRDRHPLPADAGNGQEGSSGRRLRLGGSPFAGASTVLRSPYLLGIAVFVLLLASVTTFLYFEQARLVEARFPDPVDQTRVFGTIDAIVQTLAILSQLFITGRVAQRLGIGVLLVSVPLVVAAGFLWLAFAPTFAVLAVVMIVRRAGEYAFVRPGREMLYTVVSPEAKYKGKNFIDTVVYRGADAVSGWVKTLVDMIAQQPAVAAIAGASIALVWAATGGRLARAQRRHPD